MAEKILTQSLSWSIYDSWSELLAGTRTLLDFLTEEQKKITKRNLLRLVFVSSHQMVEVMLFTQIKKTVEDKPIVKELFKYDKKRISFKNALEKWPEILTGQKLDLGVEPLQSMILLSKIRNKAIHHEASVSTNMDENKFYITLGESAFYTAIESSKAIYNHLNQQEPWNESEYAKFVEQNQAKVKKLLNAFQKYLNIKSD